MGIFSSWLGGKAQSNRATSDYGKQIFQSGMAQQDQAVGALQGDIGGYQNQIAAGGLTPSLRDSFNTARAGIMDQGQAQRNGLNSSLAQQNLQSGGVMSPQAIAEMKAMGNENIGQNEFSATNSINQNEAQMGYQATQSLMDRISSARTAVLGAANNRTQTGYGIQMGALQNMNDLRKAMLGMVSI